MSAFVADEVTPKNHLPKRMSGQKAKATMSSAGKPPKSIRSTKAVPFSYQGSDIEHKRHQKYPTMKRHAQESPLAED